LFEQSQDEYGALKTEITKFLDDLKTRISLIKLEHYRSNSVDIEKAIITIMCQDGLKSDEYFILSAK